jgi:hypothetical protein
VSQSTIKINAPRAQCARREPLPFSRTLGYRAIHVAQNATVPATFDETPNRATATFATRTLIAATPPAIATSATRLNVPVLP